MSQQRVASYKIGLVCVAEKWSIMETRAWPLAAAAAALCLLQLVAMSCAQDNIDTQLPGYRRPPEDQTNAYFGYSLVLHQVASVSAGNRDQALQNSR